MNEFEITTLIDRPVDEVFAALLDFAATPDWMPGLIEVRQTSPGPFAAGSTLVYAGAFLGRRYESAAVCTKLVSNQCLASTTVSGPFVLEIASTLKPVGRGTRLRNVYRGESQGFFKLAEPVMVRLARKQFEAAQENLKAILEGRSLPRVVA
jgi:carbon monoxide dehydrogenase subunit G